MDHAVNQTLRALVAAYAGLRVKSDEITDTDDLYELGMTSTANVNLMLALEDEFDIEFPEHMLVRETFESVGAIQTSIELIRSSPSFGG